MRLYQIKKILWKDKRKPLRFNLDKLRTRESKYDRIKIRTSDHRIIVADILLKKFHNKKFLKE